jgi:hypothetical protein
MPDGQGGTVTVYPLELRDNGNLQLGPDTWRETELSAEEIEDAKVNKVLRGLRAQQYAEDATRSAQVYGPGDGPTRAEYEAHRRVQAANAGTGSMRGVPRASW